MKHHGSKRKRTRNISKIEAELADHQLRYQRHILWVDRNERFSEKRQQYCSKIEEKIALIRSQESSHKRILGVIRTKEFTTEAKKQLSRLEGELKDAEKRALTEVPELDFPYEHYPNGRCMYSDWKAIPGSLRGELARARENKKEKEEQKNLRARAAQAEKMIEEQENLRARVAQTDDKTRNLASSLKLALPRDHQCPYCGRDLGSAPHADHIYPVSKGGLSIKANMVYVCSDCNTKKGDMTLRNFIEEYGLDRDVVWRRLITLGKDF